MVHFSQIPIVEATVNKNYSLALRPINGSIIAAKPKAADAGAGAPRCPRKVQRVRLVPWPAQLRPAVGSTDRCRANVLNGLNGSQK